MKTNIRIPLFLCCAAAIMPMAAQTEEGNDSTFLEDVSVIQPLFEYPMAPEELPSLQEKSEWLIEHFWDNLDTKSKKTVDQFALNHAFEVYISPMRWAEKSKVDASVDALLKRLEKNPALLLQMTKAAELNLYDVKHASMLIDEVYLKFAEALVKNKKIDKVRKTRYQEHVRKLGATLPGSKAPEFKFKTADGIEHEYFPMSTFTIIEFGDPTCNECRMSKLKMDVNLQIADLIEKGKLNILFIIPDEPEGWEKDLEGYPAKWTSGASEEVYDIYDIRLTPTLYTIGGDGRILSKNITVDTAIRQALEECNKPLE